MFNGNTLYASLVSGLISVVVVISVGAWLDQREIKRDVLRRLAGSRYVLGENGRCIQPNGEPFVALNEAFIVFANEPEVLDALEALRTGGDRDDENIVALIKRMAAAASVPVNLDDAFIVRPFAPPDSCRPN